MLSIFFRRGSGFLNLCLIFLQLCHFGLISWTLAHVDEAYARFSGWDLYTLFVIRVTNCGLFSNAFALLTTLMQDRHVSEGARNFYGAHEHDNAYAILAAAVHEAGAVRNDARADAVASSNAAAAAGADPGAAVAVVEQDDDTIMFVATSRTPRGSSSEERKIKEPPLEASSLILDPKEHSRFIVWVHGSRLTVLPTKGSFVAYQGDLFTRAGKADAMAWCGTVPSYSTLMAGRWVAGAIWLTLLPPIITHFIPGLITFALFIPAGALALAVSGVVVYLVFMRCLDPIAAQAAARVIARVAAADKLAIAGQRQPIGSTAAGLSDTSASTSKAPVYPCVTTGIALFICVRALVIGALISIAQLLFTMIIYHAVITFSLQIPLPASAYWNVTATWWELLDARCYVSSFATVAESTVPQSASEMSRRAFSLASYFL